MNKVSHDESQRITDVGVAYDAALVEEAQREAHWQELYDLKRQVDQAAAERHQRLVDAVLDHEIDPDPARPTDDTVDSEPHPDEDGPAYYDRDRDERDHEPILPDLSPLDQHGSHDRGADPYRIDKGVEWARQHADVLHAGDPREMVGLPSPDAQAAPSQAEPEPGSPLDTRVQGLIRDRELGYASRRKTAERVIAAVREADATGPEHLRGDVERIVGHLLDGRIVRAQAIEQLLAAYTEPDRRASHEGATVSWSPWVPMSAADIDRILAQTSGVRVQVRDAKDEHTGHDVTLGESEHSIELVSQAWALGRVYAMPTHVFPVRFAAVEAGER